MAAWSSIIWHESVHWIENGSSACETPRNPLYIRCNLGRRLNANDRDSTLLSRPRRVSLIHFRNVNHEDILTRQTLHAGVQFNIRGETARKIRQRKEKLQQTNRKSIKSFKQADYWTTGPHVFSTTNKYAKLGW